MAAHQFLINSLNERIEFNKLMKLKKEFANVIQLLSPIHRFAPKVLIAGEEDIKKEINFYPEMNIQIYFPHVLEDHIRETTEFVIEQVNKKYLVKELGFIHRILLGEEFDIDITVARAEDPEFNFILFYNLADAKRHTAKFIEQKIQIQNTRNILKLLKIWKRNKLINFDFVALEKNTAIQFFSSKPTNDYSIVLTSYLADIKKLLEKAGLNNETRRLVSAIEETIQAIGEKFFMKILN